MVTCAMAFAYSLEKSTMPLDAMMSTLRSMAGRFVQESGDAVMTWLHYGASKIPLLSESIESDLEIILAIVVHWMK